MRLATRSVAALALVSLLTVACGGGSSEGGGSNADGSASDTGAVGATKDNLGGRYPTASGSAGTTSTPPPSGPTGATGAEADVQVSVNNYLFDPDPVQVASGDVVAVRNDNTRTPHTFTVVGQDVDLELAPQETETVEIDLPTGTYRLICRFHESLGMTATLVVS